MVQVMLLKIKKYLLQGIPHQESQTDKALIQTQNPKPGVLPIIALQK